MTDVTDIAGGGIIGYPFVEGKYGAHRRLGGGVNSPAVGSHAVIAPDESFIVVDSDHWPGGQGGEGDLWVCFRKSDGSWSEGYNLGDLVNTPGTNFCPALSPDGKFLFYSSCRDIYWVSTEVILRLRVQGPYLENTDTAPTSRRSGWIPKPGTCATCTSRPTTPRRQGAWSRY